MAPLFLALVVAALLLQSFGPMLDHHFAERQHAHKHVYLGAQTTGHSHPYKEPHLHSRLLDAAVGVPGFPSLTDKPPDHIVYLTSADGIGQQFAARIMPVMQAAAIFPDPDSLLLAFAHRDNILQEAFVAPPEQPPRA